MSGHDSLRATFFEECEDLLSRMGQGLSELSDQQTEPGIETLHAVFRAVHSIKGGAGAFGLASLVAFAHVFETVLDHMRAGRMSAGPATMQTLLRAYDVLSDLVTAARDGGADPAQMDTLLAELDILAETGPSGPETAQDFDFQPLPIDIGALPGSVDEPEHGYRIVLAPGASFYANGHEPGAVIRSLRRIGKARVSPEADAVPPLSGLDLANPALRWSIELQTEARRDEVDEVFDFVGDLADVTIDALAAAPPEPTPDDAGTAAPPRPSPPVSPAQPAVATNIVPFAPTIRVNLDRVDRLINQIGELVIMEAMLSQSAASTGLRDDSDFVSSLDGIKQLAASIQESVMSIRAQPLTPVFQRMQRIVREACDATGKKVRLHMTGEATEVDRTVIERLVDPLTHMIRNSVDHGIELPAARSAAGKGAEGTITLSAAHRSGRVIIEVADDGAGIDRARVRDIAEQRGLVAPAAQLGMADIDNLLFLPGFSSKDEVTALSGRGVGLDVVRREIQALGGRVTIQSVPGRGTAFTIALPLTLAVLEGMLIGVGKETMVLPLSCIIETVRPAITQIHHLGRGERLIAIRGELIPIIDLAESFGFGTPTGLEDAVLILVECDSGRRAALAAAQIHDQRQVVIKSLEDNYGSVKGISSATILGDGRIALIIDPEEIVKRPPADPAVHLQSANG